MYQHLFGIFYLPFTIYRHDSLDLWEVFLRKLVLDLKVVNPVRSVPIVFELLTFEVNSSYLVFHYYLFQIHLKVDYLIIRRQFHQEGYHLESDVQKEYEKTVIKLNRLVHS